MALPENTNYNDVSQGIDRITQILQQQAQPVASSPIYPQAVNLPANILNAIASSSYDYGHGGSNFVQNAANYQNTQQDNLLNQQHSILNVFDAKLKMGDAQTKALNDKIALFTGDDPEGRALFLEELHNDPDQIDPTNSYQVMTKLAGIKKRTGYESPDLALKREKERVDIDYKKAQINSANALADKRTFGGDTVEKPMPATALKLQNEELDAISTAQNIDADLGSILQTIENGKLKLGPIDNLISQGRNAAGVSSENSRNFSSFKTTLEKLRNDSLRLNKGVQTEGDAVRAWNEILSNITDENLVKQRLAEVRKINERAADLRKLNVDQIRSNYGKDPINYNDYKKGAAILQNDSFGENSMQELPNPSQYKGRIITDTDTGIKYISNGKEWVPK